MAFWAFTGILSNAFQWRKGKISILIYPSNMNLNYPVITLLNQSRGTFYLSNECPWIPGVLKKKKKGRELSMFAETGL